MDRHRSWSLSYLLALALLTPGSFGFGQAQTDPATDVVNHAAAFAVSPPLRDLANLSQPQRPGFRKASRVRPIPKRAVGQIVDSVEQSTVAPGVAFSIGTSFLGLGNGFPKYMVADAPPDTNMAVGDTQIVQWVNLQFAVFDKATGNPLTSFINGNVIWSALGGVCAANNDGQPIVEWDVLAHRWLLTQNVLQSPYMVCVAVSLTPDATGGYFLYQFPVLNSGYPDYQKWGIWTNNYGQSWNNFGPNGKTFVGAVLCAYHRTKLLAGDQTAEQICHQYTSSDDSLLPADIDTKIAPPEGEDQFAIGSLGAVDNANLSLYSVHINNLSDWTQGATFTGDNNSQLIAITPFTPACGGSYGGDCVPQPGTSDLLDSLGDRLMDRFTYQCCIGLTLVPPEQHWYVNFDVTASGGQNAIHWIEFTAPVKPLSAINVFQEGTFAPDGNWRWMGSMTGDKVGDLLIGYSESCGDNCPGGTPTFPSIYVAGRRLSDRRNKLEPEVSMVAGTGSQLDTSGLWGSYSSMRLDNNDGLKGCVFWYTTEYYLVTQPLAWSTQIASAKFKGCSSIDTQTSATSFPKVSSYLQPVTLSASVTSNGNGTPTGTVDFNDTFNQDFTPLCTGVQLDNAGNAVCTTSILAVGTHTQIIGTYNGDLEFSTSSGLVAPQTVTRAASITAINSAPNPSQFNQLVTFTAVVTGAFGGTPTGTVTFSDNATPLCTNVALDSSATATCQIQTLAVGQHDNVKATYSGDQNFTGSTGKESQGVNKANTTTVLTAVPPAQSTTGEMVTFTATVTGAFGGSPTGSANFTDNGTAITGCTGVALVPQQNGGTAVCKTTSLAVGAHTIAAAYSGDGNFNLSNGSIPYAVVNPSTTVTTLSVSPPSPVKAGQVVTLTATVTSSGSPITVGTVTFSNGKQPQGTVQLVQSGGGSGTATLKMRFAPGTYSFTANYSGTSTFQSSQSSPQPYTVTGTEPTLSTLSAAPDGSNYDFSLSVFGFGFPPLSGSATLNNLTQGGTLLGNIQVPGAGTSTFQPQQTYPSGHGSFGLAVADFNADGISDLALTNKADNTVSVLLGNSDGTFQPQQTSPVGTEPAGVTTGDFNGDGILDLAIVNEADNTVSVLLGSGGGNFQVQQTYATGVQPFSVAVGDFNRDGIADLAITNNLDSTVSILLGNGDGTFLPQQTSATGAGPVGVAVADFNRDGIADLAITNSGDNTVSILLGNGDGTFQPQQTYATGATPYGVAVADFNGDGFADLAIANLSDNTVSVLLGNPSNPGTFQAQQIYTTGTGPVGVAVADFNGDGKADLVITDFGNTAGTTSSVLLGNGDGTFQPQQTFATELGPFGVAVADFNGDGVPDLAVANSGGNTASVLIGGTVSTGSVKNIPAPGSGLQNVQSNFTPNGTFFAGSVSNIVPVTGTGGQVQTNTVITSSQNPSSYLQPVTFTATVTAVGGGSPTGTVTFTADQKVICSAVPLVPIQNGSTATCTIATLTVPAHGIQGSYSGDSSFAPSESQLFTQIVMPAATTTVLTAVPPGQSKFGQLVTFTAMVTGAFGGSPTGAVRFSDNLIPIAGCDAVTLVPQQNGSMATCSTTSLAIGPHSISGNYSGDPDFQPSSGSIPYTVLGLTATTTTLASSLNPSSYLQPVTFTATVTDNGGSPTGTVTFTADQVVICNTVPLTPIQNGSVATCTIATLGVGGHSIGANYSGDSNFAPSSGTLNPNQVVNAAATTTVLTANPPGASSLGQPVTFTATVTGAFGGSPNGTVEFLANGADITGCSAVQLVPQSNGSTATCTTTSLAAGSYNIIGSYSGDPEGTFSSSIGSIPYLVRRGTATTTSLSISPASPVIAGQVVTLTAAVTSGGGGIGLGTVTFFSGTTVLGTVQLVEFVGAAPQAPGTATLKTRFAPGTYSLSAQFNQTNDFASSASSPQPYTVTGTEPTLSTLSATPDSQNYDFALSVFGFGFPPLLGNGAAYNLTGGGALVGNIPLPGPGMSSFQPQQTYALNGAPLGVAVADFNGDGILDLAITDDNGSSSTVSVLLGNGDGTFQSAKTYPVGVAPYGIAVGDFNGDGIPDLAVTNTNDNTVSVLIGNGDGTFQTQQTYRVGTGPTWIAMADFNGDGVADLAVTNGVDNSVSILLGNGDGTFLVVEGTEPAGTMPSFIVASDFNGDGIADLAVTNTNDSTVSVLLGNGNGSFQSQQTYSTGTGSAPFGLAVADFNGDGFADLATANSGTQTVSVLLGKGDGTFKPQQSYQVGRAPVGVAVADFNGDSIADLAVTNDGGATVSVLLGNGDGTFQAQQSYPVGTEPSYLAVGDFNGDGVPDLAVPNLFDGTVGILIGGTVSTGVLNNVPVYGSGNQSVQSSFTPNGSFKRPFKGTSYGSSLSNTVQVVGVPGLTTTTKLTSSLNPSMFKQSVTFTATVTASDGSLPSGLVTFQSNGVNIPDCPNPVNLVRGVAACTTQSLAVGQDTITASYNDPQGFYGSSSATLLQMVGGFSAQISPSSATVIQGYNNGNEPFFATTINVTVQPLFGYSGTVTLSCTVNPILVGGTCVVNPPSSGSLATGNLNTTLTITAGSTTPIGPYTVTVTAQDANGMMQFATLVLAVIDYAQPINEPPGGGGMTMVNYNGPGGVGIPNFACTAVTGTGINGSEPLSQIGGSCAFGPGPMNLPGAVKVTISGCTVARLRTRTPIFAAFFLGLPAMVLLGSVRLRRLPGKRMLQVLGTLLLLLALLMGVGCGAGGSGQLTPPGMYLVLVQGTGTDGAVYSGVVPVNVSGGTTH